jgi:hypothetical protein
MKIFIEVKIALGGIGFVALDNIDCILEQKDGRVLIITIYKAKIWCDMSIEEIKTLMIQAGSIK